MKPPSSAARSLIASEVMRGAKPNGFHTDPAMPNASQPATYLTGGGLRPWYVLYSSGKAQMTEAGTHTIMERTGLSAQDLRILDPLSSYPSTVLGREKAIVINLEHIKAIITAQEVLLLNSNDPSVSPFINKLQRRILFHHQAIKPQEEENSEGGTHKRTDPPQGEAVTPQLSGDKGIEANNIKKSKVLPFEFVVLEACLESASISLENEALRLVLEANQALDKLTSEISTLNLERAQQIKIRLVAITGRVQKVRDELENLLHDDKDMAEMYLTEKLEKKLENSSTVEVDLCEGDEVQELGMLLQAYFLKIDGTLNKLSTLREYVDDTEDNISIKLDDKQSHLLQMGVKLTLATIVISAFVAVANDKAGPRGFIWTVVGTSLACLFLDVSFYFSKKKRFA